MKPNYTIKEAAAILRVSENTVARLTLAGILPIIRVSPRRVVIPCKAVDNYRGIAWQSGSAGGITASSSSKAESAYFAVCRKVAPKGRRKSLKRSSDGKSSTATRSAAKTS